VIVRCSLKTLLSLISPKLVSLLIIPISFPNFFLQFHSIITVFETGVDSRKRSREVYSSALMNPPPPKPSQVIDITELLQKTPNVVSTGLRLFHDQSQNQQQFFSSLPGDVTGKIKRQRDELDRFIQTQVSY